MKETRRKIQDSQGNRQEFEEWEKTATKREQVEKEKAIERENRDKNWEKKPRNVEKNIEKETSKQKSKEKLR